MSTNTSACDLPDVLARPGLRPWLIDIRFSLGSTHIVPHLCGDFTELVSREFEEIDDPTNL